MSPRLEAAVEAVYRAGRSTLPGFQAGLEVENKEDRSPVTEADRHAERLIRESLEARFPGEAVLGEEQGLTGSGDDRWVVDPIDGTKSYISGVPLYATLLGWEVGGEPVLGVCYFPALDEMLYAEKGQGCFFNGRRVRVREPRGLENATVCHGSLNSFAQIGKQAELSEVLMHALIGRTWGDAYGHALVATGRVDAMLDPVVNRWDVSAMAIIVREAGGFFGQLDGTPEIGDSALSCATGLEAQIGTVFSR